VKSRAVDLDRMPFDDCYDDGFFRVPHTDGVGRAVEEIEKQGEFRVIKRVCRLAHLERVR
jgi:hypothetical protein